MGTLAEAAKWWHGQGLCVIPVKPRDKAPLLPAWEVYQTRQSTAEEIDHWWGTTPDANIGIVHGINQYITIDIDHDNGMLSTLRTAFPALTAGIIEQSGSGEGYHLPLFVAHFPDLGWDNSRDRAKGNKTWKTKRGALNIRCQWCQSVVPPSIHPSGGRYQFIQRGQLARVDNLKALVVWLNALDPQPLVKRRPPQARGVPVQSGIKAYFPDLVAVFSRLGITGEVNTEPNGELRIRGHGGLLIHPDTQQWYCFSDEMGGDVIDAWGWVRYHTGWDHYDRDKYQHVLSEMKAAAGVEDDQRQRT
jgi:hypothetical protein